MLRDMIVLPAPYTGGDSTDDVPQPTMSIKVLNSQRKLTDPSIANYEELKIVLKSLQDTLQVPSYVLATYMDIAKSYRSEISSFMMDINTSLPSDSVLESFQVRILLTNPSVYPIVSARGFQAIRSESDIGIHTRPLSARNAIDIAGKFISIAAEEPIIVIGLSIRKKLAGSFLRNSFNLVGNLRDAIYTGNISPATYATFTNNIPEYVSNEFEYTHDRAGFVTYATVGDHKNLLETLLAQIRFSISMNYSGASVTLAALKLARIQTKPKYIPPSIRKYLTALKASSDIAEVNVLSNQSTSIVEIDKSTWRDQNANSILKYIMEKLKHLEHLYPDSENYWKYDLTPINDIFGIGAMPIYMFVTIDGRETEKLDAFIESSTVRNMSTANLKQSDTNFRALVVKAKLYMTIVEDKFGTSRSNAVLTKLRSTVMGSRIHNNGIGSRLSELTRINDPNSILELLTAPEQKVVISEYNNRMELWKSSSNNKCPHVELARSMRTSTTNDKMLTHFSQLQAYFDNKSNPNSWIDCKNCGFHIMCPHVRDQIELQSKNKSYDDITSKLMKYAIKIVSSGKTMGTNVYAIYCNICSELLVESYDISSQDEAIGKYGNFDDPLRSKIWGMAIRAVKFIRFKIPIDDRRFANRITLAVYPMVVAAEESVSKKQRRRKKMNSDTDDIDPRTQLYAILFIFAYILNLIQSSSGDGEIGLIDVKTGLSASKYAEHILNIISENYRSLIFQVEDITSEYIKSRFTEAYKIVRSQGKSSLQHNSPEEAFAFYVTYMDPVYHYAVVMAKISSDLPAVAKNTPAGARKEFDTVFGMGILDIVKMAKAAKVDPEFNQVFSKSNVFTVSVGTTMEFLIRHPKLNIYGKMYEPKYINADDFYDFNAEESNAKVRKKSIYLAYQGAFYEAYRLFASYTKYINTVAKYDTFIEEQNRYKTAMSNLHKVTQYVGTRAYDNTIHPSAAWGGHTTIAHIYDESGKKHNWGKRATFVYSNGETIMEVEGGEKEVSRRRMNNDMPPDMEIVDIKCPICGVNESNISSLNTDTVLLSVIAENEINSFYLFYESRCPQGELHDWNSDQVCTKCKASVSMIKESSSREYYDKHRNQFKIDFSKTKQSNYSRDLHQSDNVSVSQVSEHDTKQAAEWKPDYTYIIKISELVGVPPTIVEAISNTEGRVYEEVIDGVGIPPPVEELSDPRLYTANAEVQSFFTEYNRLRTSSKALKIFPHIELILDAVKVPKHEYGMLLTLPDIHASYYSVLSAMYGIRTPAEIHTYMIYTLCELILTMSTPLPNENIVWMNELRLEFAKTITRSILRGQKLFAKPGTFDWAIFAEDEAYNPEPSVDAGVAGEDVYEAAVAKGEEIVDVFEGDMDYDTSDNNPNNAPGDFEI